MKTNDIKQYVSGRTDWVRIATLCEYHPDSVERIVSGRQRPHRTRVGRLAKAITAVAQDNGYDVTVTVKDVMEMYNER